FFFCNAPAPPATYTLSLHDALPIWGADLVAHVGEEFTLHAARFFRRATRLVELVRLILELPHQFPRQANGADQSRAHPLRRPRGDRKSTRLNSSHQIISYAVFCLKK